MLTPTRTRRFQKLVTPLTQPARSSLSWVKPSSSTETEPSPSVVRLQELVEVQIATSRDQTLLIQQQKKVELDTPNLVELTRDAYVKFKSDNDTYLQKKGIQTMVARIVLAKLKVIAVFIAKVSVPDPKLFRC